MDNSEATPLLSQENSMVSVTEHMLEALEQVNFGQTYKKPAKYQGWLKKKSRSGVIRNWQNRFFIIQEGLLKYYESYDAEKFFPIKEKGHLYLQDASLKPAVDNSPNQLLISSGISEDNDLLVEAESHNALIEFKKAILDHIKYANDLHNKVNADEIGFSGDPPSEMQSWMLKLPRHKGLSNLGSLVGSWEKRYFVLSEGVLEYYTDYNEESVMPSNKKGQLILANSKLETDLKKYQIVITLQEEVLILQSLTNFPNLMNECILEWELKLNENIKFATANERSILKKLELLNNSTAHFRETKFSFMKKHDVVDQLKQKMLDKVIGKMSDALLHEFQAAVEKMLAFIFNSPLSCHVLSFCCGIVCFLYGALSFFFLLLDLQICKAAISLFITLCGVVSIGYEYQFNMMPSRYFNFLYRELRVIFSPYGRVHVYLFLGVLVASSSGSILSLDANAFETLIVGLFLVVVSIIMLFNTRKALANIAAIKARHIPAKTLLEAFNKADSSKNGELDLKEFTLFLSYANISLSEDDMDIAMLELDRTRNYEVSWQEFITWYCNMNM